MNLYVTCTEALRFNLQQIQTFRPNPVLQGTKEINKLISELKSDVLQESCRGEGRIASSHKGLRKGDTTQRR